MFLRPCFLVVDHEFAGSISSRKLVIETAKFNVITAYSFDEAVATLAKFPALDAAVVTADQHGKAADFLKTVRSGYPRMKTVLTGDLPDGEDFADRRVRSFAPEELLAALRELFPQDTKTARKIEEELAKEEGES